LASPWLEGVPLRIRYPCLFAISKEKQMFVLGTLLRVKDVNEYESLDGGEIYRKRNRVGKRR